MRCDSGKLIDSFINDSDGSDESDDSDVSAGSSPVDSDDSADSEAEEEESETEEQNANNQEAASSQSPTANTEEDEEEEDEVVKAIIRSKDLHLDHPPTINMEDHIVDICFHPEKDLIAVASITGDVHMYKYSNTETSLISSIELHLKACRDIEFNDEGTVLYSAAKDLSIMLTDVETEKLTRLYENAHDYPVYTLTVIDKHTFVTGDDDGVVKFWDLRQKGSTPVFSMKKMEDYVSDIITNRDAKYLVCSSGDGSLTTFNVPERRLFVQSEEYDEELTCLGLFKNERKVLTTTSKGKMYMFNWGEFGLHSDEFPNKIKKSINCIVPITETMVITGGEDGVLRATSLFPHRQLGVVGQHDLCVESMDVNSDGRLIASSSHNNDIKFWNVAYFETIHVDERPKGGSQKQFRHNLPSSKVANTSDFFADL